VATSRRRERELARRRFERRRQAELERRAKAKKRNTVLGAVVGTVVLVGAVTGGAFWAFGGSGTSKASAIKPAATPAVTPSASVAPAPPAPTKCAKISPDPAAKGEPTVPQVKGKLTSKLVTKDIKIGHGPAAKAGDALVMKYVGISCDTGKAFDASYTDPSVKNGLFDFTLGKGQVISGWDQGIVGMKAGGVRELVIPASLAYGTAGSGSTIAGNDTLVFVVTLVKV
jgi:peptidylprolyl isomerase